MSADALLTLNAGSSTVKVGLFEACDAGLRSLAKGMIDFRLAPPSFRLTEGPTTFDVKLKTDVADIRGVMAETFGWLAKHFDTSRVAAVGHRVVHGGDSYGGPIRIDDATIEALDKLTMLAPLHQPESLRLIRAIRRSASGPLVGKPLGDRQSLCAQLRQRRCHF